jgi:hypothetical protein
LQRQEVALCVARRDGHQGFQSMAAVLRSFFMEYQRKKEGWFKILI